MQQSVNKNQEIVITHGHMMHEAYIKQGGQLTQHRITNNQIPGRSCRSHLWSCGCRFSFSPQVSGSNCSTGYHTIPWYCIDRPSILWISCHLMPFPVEAIRITFSVLILDADSWTRIEKKLFVASPFVTSRYTMKCFVRGALVLACCFLLQLLTSEADVSVEVALQTEEWETRMVFVCRLRSSCPPWCHKYDMTNYIMCVNDS